MKAKLRSSWRWKLAALAASTILSIGFAMPSIADQDNNDHGNGNQHNGGGSNTQTPIKHVVVIFQENVSFDHYFATYPVAQNMHGEPTFVARDDTPTVNGLSPGLLSPNNPNLRQPFRLNRAEAYTCSQDHNYTDEQKAYDGGLMDKFVQATAHLGLGCRTDGSTDMAYFDGNTVTALWNYAQNYAMSDNSYDSDFGPSTPGAINLVSGQTGKALLVTAVAGGKITSTTPVTITGDSDPALDDCGADQGGTHTGSGTLEATSPNVGDLLNAKKISWGFFEGGFAPMTPAKIATDGTTITPAVCASSHPGHPNVPNPSVVDGNTNPPTDIHGPVTDYVPHHQPFQYYASTRNPHHLRPNSVAEIGHDGPANHQYDISDFFSALNAHNLPSVSYLKAPAYQDGHPGNSDPLSEQTFVVDVINALQQSSDWQDTAVIVNYDDTDGWYDHVLSPIVNQSANNHGSSSNNASTNANDSLVAALPLSTSAAAATPGAITTSGVCGMPGGGAIAGRCGYGPRLPFMVVSPWAKANFVDHTIIDQSSSIAFIEYNWNLGFLDGPNPPPAGTGSYDRVAGSILGMFDFDNKPNNSPVILSDTTGEIVHGGHGGF